MMEICRAAIETCVWPLFEVVDGEWVLNYEPKNKLPVTEYLKLQGRFDHLFAPGNEWLIERIQNDIDNRWKELKYRCYAL